MDSLTISSTEKIIGILDVPGDKSISHRTLILGSLTKRPLEISNLNQGEDVAHTRKALEELGVCIQNVEKGRVRLECLKSFTPPKELLYLGNSGTSARLLMGLLSSCDFETHILGDVSLQKRPMKRVMDPLSLMGVYFEDTNGCLPVIQKGRAKLQPISYRLPVPSAQLKSALLIAALSVNGITRIIEPVLSRDHTELLMQFLDMPLKIYHESQERVLEVTGSYVPNKGKDLLLDIPGDPSAAAFWIVSSLLVKDSNLKINNVCWNPFRNVFIDVLKKMGGNIQIIPRKSQMGEECADIISQTSLLHGIEISADLAPSLIDEYPILAVAAAFAKGRSVCRGLKELRFKESNRLEAMEVNLKACGVRCYVEGNDLFIEGGEFDPIQNSIEIHPYHDHRIAMAFSIFALAYDHSITIHQTKTVKSSDVNFYKHLLRFSNLNPHR
ncbi:MAG: 3-phosphoshikimate 1-carboxyvinyltransferase [Alphaproteobacteria bacterium]|nr:3-phosphoshikimate 1-carboxyvinyltransferase [Alphaproteobacteria bacterium]